MEAGAPTKTELRTWVAITVVATVVFIVLLLIGYAMYKGYVTVEITGKISSDFFLGLFSGLAGASFLWLWREKKETAG
jgi:hypothetical protein